VLQHYSPQSFIGDGNCFYRAVSLGLFGTQNFHEYLRFRTAVQLLSNPNIYDVDSDEFIMKDKPMLTPQYRDVVRFALNDGYEAELIHVFALSAALHITIQCYACPEAYMGSDIHPYTMTIKDNMYVHEMAHGHLTIMWSHMRRNHKGEPNHFTLLVPRNWWTGIASHLSNEPPAMNHTDDASQHSSGSVDDVESQYNVESQQKSRQHRQRNQTPATVDAATQSYHS
jgi:hypothetical protein